MTWHILELRTEKMACGEQIYYINCCRWPTRDGLQFEVGLRAKNH